MNIFYSTGMRSAAYGGFERLVVRLAEGLSARGHRLIVQYEELPRDRSFMRDLQSALAEVVIIRTKGRIPGALRDFLASIKREKIALVHANFGVAQYISVAAGLLSKGVRTVCQFHSIDDEKTRTGIRTMFVSRFSDMDLCPSNAVRQSIIRYGAPTGKVRVIPHGVVIPEKALDKTDACGALSLDPGGTILMCVAWDNPVKGIDLLLRAMPRVAEAVEDIKLWVVGSACDCSANRELAREMGVEDRVEWLGIRRVMPDLMSCCDIYVQPSRSEAFSLAAAEAMASGKPVAAFRVGGISEVVEDGVTGFLADPGDIAALGELIIKLARNDGLRRSMGGAGRARAQRLFDIGRESREMIACYEELSCGREEAG